MITPSTDVARGGLSNTEARATARTENGADFREQVSRERTRERESARGRADEPVRSAAPEPGSRAEDDREAGASRDEATSDAPADASASSAEDARSAPQDQAADPNASREQPAARSTTTGEATKDSTAPRAAKPEPDPLAAGLPVVISAPALEPAVALPFAAASARTSADAAAPPVSVAGDDSAPGVARVSAKAVADSAGIAADAQIAVTDVSAHDAALPEGFELPREAHPARATDGGTSALAVAARGNAAVADLSPAAAAAPVATQRLAPAELPQFLGDLQVRVDGAAGSALVELEPLELGRLTVELSLQPEGGVRADVRAERPDGYAAIEARLPELRASLMDRGFASADVQISLGLAPRDPRRDPEAGRSRRAQRNADRQLDAERVLALAPARTGSIDLWA